MKSVWGGLLVIAVGLLTRQSVFLGDFTVRSIAFDAVGVFFLGYGLVAMLRKQQP